MEEKDRVPQELAEELERMRRRVAELEQASTEAEQAKEAFRGNESKFRILFKYANDAMLLLKGKVIVDCNAKMLEVFGCPRDDVIEKEFAALFPDSGPDGSPPDKRATRIIEAALSGAPQAFESQLRRCDGSLFYGEISLNRIEAEEQGLLQGMVRDITSRKAAEETLNESERKFRDLAEKSMVGIYLLQDGRFKYINTRCAEIHGYSVEELLRIGAKETVFPEDLQIVMENLRRREAGEVRSLHYEFRIVTKTGAIRHVEVFGSSTFYQGKPAVIGTLLDITERKETEERIKSLNRELRERVAELDAANEELQALNYSISHDVRTPLITIGGFSRRILDKYSSQLDPKCLEYVELIYLTSFRMEQFINDLLAFFSSGRKQIDAVPINTEELVREVMAELESLHPDRKIHLGLGALPTLHGDRTMIRQVWANLLHNAVKFSKTQETMVIDVACRTETERHVCYVRDHGVGFPMGQADKLFQVFSRLHTDPGFEGTGIGLAIVKRVIQRHGGEVWAESEAGEGATFYFSLPKVA